MKKRQKKKEIQKRIIEIRKVGMFIVTNNKAFIKGMSNSKVEQIIREMSEVKLDV